MTAAFFWVGIPGACVRNGIPPFFSPGYNVQKGAGTRGFVAGNPFRGTRVPEKVWRLFRGMHAGAGGERPP